jgi:hypothetical protein
MQGEPAYEAARVPQVVALLLEGSAVDEVLDELEISHSNTRLPYLTSDLTSH